MSPAQAHRRNSVSTGPGLTPGHVIRGFHIAVFPCLPNIHKCFIYGDLRKFHGRLYSFLDFFGRNGQVATGGLPIFPFVAV
jgi:hypothetical protein